MAKRIRIFLFFLLHTRCQSWRRPWHAVTARQRLKGSRGRRVGASHPCKIKRWNARTITSI